MAGLLASAMMCVGALVLIGPTYEDKAVVLLLPPGSSVPAGENPYLELSGLAQMVDVLSKTLYSQPVRLTVQQRWPSAEFTVEPDATTSGPLLVISVQDSSPARAQELTTYLMQLLPDQLRRLQTDLGVRPRAMITADTLTQYSKPEVTRSKQVRAGIVAGGVGLVGTLMLIGLIDRALVARRRARESLAAGEAPPAPAVPLDPGSAVPVDGVDGWQWGDVDSEAAALSSPRNGQATGSRATW